MRKMLKARKLKKPTRSKLIREADRVFSLHNRKKYANSEGMVKCFTCENRNHWKKMQNSHWIVRQYKYVRWDEDNARPACYACNMLFNGRPHIFRENLVNEIGEVRVKALELRAKTLFTEKDDFIEAVIEKYKT